ncbi:MAG: KH domain-containing protein [SAR202 cluster bacterium]|nr:KH domain-containing protein [SAR202 cluster bacterium]
MKELVEYMARALAHDPDAVRVSETEQDGVKVIQLEVGPEDKGRVIGKQGRVAQAMRLMLRVAAVKDGSRATLQII